MGWWGQTGLKLTRVTRRTSEAGTPLGLGLGSVAAGERAIGVLARAFPQCLLRTCCMPERDGNSHGESDQGFPESHKFYGKGSAGSMHFGLLVLNLQIT